MHEYRQKLETIKEEVDHAVQQVNLPSLHGKVKILTEATQKPDFWQHQEEAQRITKELNAFQKEIAAWEKMQGDVKELLELFPSVKPEEDQAAMVLIPRASAIWCVPAATASAAVASGSFLCKATRDQ